MWEELQIAYDDRKKLEIEVCKLVHKQESKKFKNLLLEYRTLVNKIDTVEKFMGIGGKKL